MAMSRSCQAMPPLASPFPPWMGETLNRTNIEQGGVERGFPR